MPNSPRFFRVSTVVEITGIPKSSLWAMCQKGLFPSPVKVSPKVTAFHVADVEAFIASRLPVYAASQSTPV